MKSIALSFCAALVASAALALAAEPARAGLDFTDTAVNGGGTSDFTFNGTTVIGAGTVMNSAFGGATVVTVSSNLTSGTLGPTFGRVEFQYSGAFNNTTVAQYDTVVGANPASVGYTMVVEFGSITLAPGTGSALLQSIDFREPGSGFLTVFNFNQTLTAADSNTKLFIFIPSTGVNSIPLSERDLVQSVRLQFLMTGGSGTSIGIKAVVNPEPGTVALFGLGLAGIAGAVNARRRRRVAVPQNA